MSISFIAVPKCASIATEHFCKANRIPVHWHSYKLGQWIKGTSERMEADMLFAIMRDPVDRVLSAYYYLKGGGRNEVDACDWRRYCGGFQDFADFIEFGLEPASRNQLHFIPQWFWIDPPGQDADISKIRLLRFSHLSEDLRKLSIERGLRFDGIPHRNRSNREGAIVTPEQEAKIRHIYAKDYAILNEIS